MWEDSIVSTRRGVYWVLTFPPVPSIPQTTYNPVGTSSIHKTTTTTYLKSISLLLQQFVSSFGSFQFTLEDLLVHTSWGNFWHDCSWWCFCCIIITMKIMCLLKCYNNNDRSWMLSLSLSNSAGGRKQGCVVYNVFRQTIQRLLYLAEDKILVWRRSMNKKIVETPLLKRRL